VTLEAYAYDLSGNEGVSEGIDVLVDNQQDAVVNAPPTAQFSVVCTSLNCEFSDGSSDGDGYIASWNWNFGDGSTSTDQNPVHDYGAAGSYNVTLEVTDDGGLTDATTKTATVGQTATEAITLSVDGRKNKGAKYADLTWSGADSSNADIYRSGRLIVTTVNDGKYTDGPFSKGKPSTYQVCETGTSVCSKEVTLGW
jgi:PKD repeat protein